MAKIMYCALSVNAAKKINKTNNIFRIYFKNVSSSSEYTQTPQYPPIHSLTKEAVAKRDRQKLYDKYKALNTVEEKLFAVNLPRYYGWNSLILNEGQYPYNFLPFVQHITKTRLVNTDRAAFHNAQLVNSEECQEILGKIRSQLKEAIVFEIKGRRHKHETNAIDQKMSDSELKNLKSSSVIERINNIIISNLSSSYPHLFESIADYKPRVEAFWSVGGFHPSEELYNKRDEDKKLSEDEKNECVDHWIQYFGKPILQMRSTLPLNVLNTESLQETNPESELKIPIENHDPALAYGLQFERRHGTNIPGFWPGDVHEYSLLSYHGRGHLLDRPPHFGPDECEMTINAQAILASYSWLHSLACYQGFTTFHDLTYPMVTQSVVTDGQYYSFFLYQLNTMLMHSDNIHTNPRINLCLTLPTTPLYSHIEGTEIIGWDENVLCTLISLYLNIPQERVGVSMKPYLNPTERYICNIEDEERRTWLHNQFRHMYSNRPRHRLPYEIYDWERIYKIKFETRPMEAHMRPFELDANPIEDRKYYEHMPPYIPRKLRSKRKHWSGWRAKFAKTYYPDV